MTLSQLVDHFNQMFHHHPRSSTRAPFAIEEGAVVGGFYGMRLESVFATLRDPAGQEVGHQAQLKAFSPRGNSVSPRAPYAVALDEDSIVYLDRQIRTLHVLNAIAQARTGLLFLEIHPWHIARVPGDHGRVFEGILRDCGLAPQDIVLEIADAAMPDDDHLARAIASFEARGFGIALLHRSHDPAELDRLLRLGPAIIQLGQPHLAAAETSADQARALAQRVQQIRDCGIRVFLQGVSTGYQAQIAGWVSADGYQDSICPSVEDTTVILVPGLGDSGPDHWQTRWQRAHPAFLRVRQRDWWQPEVTDWVEGLDREIRRAPSPVILVGHSLGCITIAEWARHHWADIRGALLVAPADVDRCPFFDGVPLRPLPFPSILVASENDPHVELARAKLFARHWGSRLENLGRVGHINVESGFGPWPQGETLLAEVRAGVRGALAGSPLQARPASCPALA